MPSPYDPRDYSIFNIEVVDYFRRIGVIDYISYPETLPISVDNRNLCSPITDQGGLGSCVSFANVGILEYFENLGYSTFQDACDASRV